MTRPEHFEQYTYPLLRIVSGFMFAFHGAQKILGIFTEGMPPIPIGSQMWFGGMIELFGGLLIMLGLFTRWTAFLCSGMMAVAYFQFHWKLQLGPMMLPGLNRGELAALYCFVFLFIWSHGPGRWSLDALRRSGASRKR